MAHLRRLPLPSLLVLLLALLLLPLLLPLTPLLQRLLPAEPEVIMNGHHKRFWQGKDMSGITAPYGKVLAAASKETHGYPLFPSTAACCCCDS